MEKRNININFEVEDTEDGVVYGKFICFDEITKLSDGVYEKICPLDEKSIIKNDVKALWNHDDRLVVGRCGNESLELTIKNDGIYGKIHFPNTSYADDLKELLKNGYVNQCSFGFSILIEDSEPYLDGVLFKIRAIELYEISIVTFPAYKNTFVSARNVKSIKEELFRKRKEEILSVFEK